MLHILAVDDEAPALEALVYLLRSDPRVGEVRTATDGVRALLDIGGAMESGRPLDAVFLDIAMPGLDGFSVASALSRVAQAPSIVFVTARDDRAVEAFTAHAVDYVLKPISHDRVAEAVRRVALRAGRLSRPWHGAVTTPSDEVIPVMLGGVTRFIRRSEVLYVEAHGDYARLHAQTGNHLVRIPLATLEERWRDDSFVRTHRSYLVAMREVTEVRLDYGGTFVRLGDRMLPVSRRHVRQVRDALARQAWADTPRSVLDR
ncbi:LytR/AlgR family response regulator transcription factor [Streptomyces zhihengii]|uniref:Response regulator transcription factor n=1 Tax=Streptomyces zhihengii TaxID=1818004 RepID=A0ABS2V3Z8_9ACTN|nr:LytTR family DNA-binding domain-containing protein [Streptomyces zhihengii]MBM9624556.1 response regulator transcription factor [Streptomyces zhihengii]